MKRPILLALGAALLSSPALADTLFDYVNGVQVDAAGHLEHFSAVLVGDDGKVIRLIHPGEARPKAAHIVNEHERTMLHGFIDAHGHVIELGEHWGKFAYEDFNSPHCAACGGIRFGAGNCRPGCCDGRLARHFPDRCNGSRR